MKKSLHKVSGMTAGTVSQELLEAFIFLTIRHGYRDTFIISADNRLLHGPKSLDEIVDSGEEEIEAIEFDPDTPGLAELAEYNNRPDGVSPIAERREDSTDELERDPEHAEHLAYADETEFEDIDESFNKYGKLQPVYYVEFIRDGKRIKSVIDGWKSVLHARKNGINQIFAYRLNIGNNDDLLSIMLLLQRSNHSDMWALYRMCEALWPKYYRGQGYRSDITDTELSDMRSEHKGKRKNIYEKIATELLLSSGNTVKFLLKVGRVNALHFARIEKSRFTLYHAYLECLAEEKGILPPVPPAKEPRTIRDMTQPPTYSEGTTTGPVNYSAGTNTGPVTHSEPTTTYDSTTNGPDQVQCDHQGSGDSKVARGVLISEDDTELMAEVTCPYCGNTFSVIIKKDNI
jgi:hypothetical protein